MGKNGAVSHVIVVLLMISMLVFFGCGAPPHREKISKDMDPQGQEKILQQARADFEQGRDTEVINELNRFLLVQSSSPREKEARWLLAQSYERSGMIRAAQQQYHLLAQLLPPGSERQQVLQYMDDLQQRLGRSQPQLGPSKAVRASLSQFSGVGNVSVALKELVQGGATSVLIDLGCSGIAMQPSRTTLTAIDVSPQSQLPALVGQLHQFGLLAFAGLNLRCVGYWDSRSRQEWLDGSYDPATRKVQLSRYFDIFHPQYQQLLAFELRKLAGSGVDGVVFLAEVPLGVYDGLTPSSVEGFNETFATRLNPETLFENGLQQPNSQPSPAGNQQAGSSASESTDFWRWAGWKARQRLAVLHTLMEVTHQHKATLSFGLEVHPESINNPLGALTHYSEDFFEASQKGFSFFLITARPDRQIPSGANISDVKAFIRQTSMLVERMTLVIKDPAKIWLTIPWNHKTPLTEISDSLDTTHLQKVSRVYDLQRFLDK